MYSNSWPFSPKQTNHPKKNLNLRQDTNTARLVTPCRGYFKQTLPTNYLSGGGRPSHSEVGTRGREKKSTWKVIRVSPFRRRPFLVNENVTFHPSVSSIQGARGQDTAVCRGESTSVSRWERLDAFPWPRYPPGKVRVFWGNQEGMLFLIGRWKWLEVRRLRILAALNLDSSQVVKFESP